MSALALAVLALSAAGPSEEAVPLERSRARRALADLGFTAARRATHRGDRVGLPLITRADRVLLRGQLQLGFSAEAVPADVRALDVLLNGERLARIPRTALLDASTMQLVDLDERLLSGRDALALALVRDDPCVEVEPGSWRFVRQGFLETEGTPLPLPPDLALLPLPFVDPDFERLPHLDLVLPRLDPAALEVAAVVVGGFATRIEGRVRPRVFDSPPDGPAIAVVTSAADAATLGRPPPEGSRAEVVEREGKGHLLVISGPTPEAARLAAAALFASPAVEGRAANYQQMPTSSASPSRWVDVKTPVSLERTGSGTLSHRGTLTGTLRTSFRVAPDLEGWPWPSFDLKVRHRRVAADDTEPARIDVEFNGQHVGTIRAHDTSGRVSEASMEVPFSSLRGFNELVFHVRFPSATCGGGIDDPNALLEILPETRLHLEHLKRAPPRPNVELFAFDGYPFTNAGDLRHTLVLLPPDPTKSEVGVFLSAVGHMAAVTGNLPLGLEVQAETKPPRPGLDRHLLLIGRFEAHPALRAWASAGPSRFRTRPIVQRPRRYHLGRALLAGELGFSDLERARADAQRWTQVSALSVFPSPLAPDRVVVSLAAATEDALPFLDVFQGYATARRRGGDLILAGRSDGEIVRSRHQLGGPDAPTLGEEPLGWLRAASIYWVAWIPLTLLGLVVVVPLFGRSLERQRAARLSLVAGEGPLL